MSVIDTIDTTVTVEWGAERTIGTLIEMNGQSAVLTALRLPESGSDIAFRVEGETEEEAVTIDGICVDIEDTGWGERRATIDLLRIGTTCSASRLRDFIESWAIARGGSVHIGQSREQPTVKRFVYHVPDPGTRAVPSYSATTPSLPQAQTDDLDLPSQVIDRQRLAAVRRSASESTPHVGTSTSPERRHVGTSTSPSVGRRPPRETIPASSAAWVAGDMDLDDDEFDLADVAERTINSDVAASFVGGGGLDAAFREALRAVEQPRMPSRAALSESGPPATMFETGPSLIGDYDDDEEPEPTQLLDAIADDAEVPTVAFETGELSTEEVSQLMAKIDDAIEFERAIIDTDGFDADEPIVVNTVPLEIPFADPVQLGNDNRAPTMAQVAGQSEPGPTLELDLPAPKAAARPESPGRGRRMTVAETLSLPLKAPTPIAIGEEEEPAPAPTLDSLMERVDTREPSEALKRIAEVFSVDIAVRCDIAVQVVIGRKKADGRVLRLAESKLRIVSPGELKLYQRLTILFPDPAGGKKPFQIPAEVVRVRERDGEDVPLSYDMRISPGCGPKDMAQLRSLIQSFQAGA
ncbi:MAG: hypothetical protein RIT45_3066 [Pseudomonadota bacterium]